MQRHGPEPVPRLPRREPHQLQVQIWSPTNCPAAAHAPVSMFTPLGSEIQPCNKSWGIATTAGVKGFMETSLVSVDVGSEKQAYLLLALEWAPTELCTRGTGSRGAVPADNPHPAHREQVKSALARPRSGWGYPFSPSSPHFLDRASCPSACCQKSTNQAKL